MNSHNHPASAPLGRIAASKPLKDTSPLTKWLALGFVLAVLLVGPIWWFHWSKGGIFASVEPIRPAVIAPQPAYLRVARPLPGNTLPVYPFEAQQQGLTGKLIAHILVNPDGTVSHIDLVPLTPNLAPQLATAVTDALQTWRFEPAMQGGHPIGGNIQVPIEFNLDR